MNLIVCTGGFGGNYFNWVMGSEERRADNSAYLPVDLKGYGDVSRILSLQESDSGKKNILFVKADQSNKRLVDWQSPWLDDIEKYDQLIVVSGCGGTAGALLSSQTLLVAKSKGVPSAAILVFPFGFEGRKRLAAAQSMLDCARVLTDRIRVISNDDGMRNLSRRRSTLDHFKDVWVSIDRQVSQFASDTIDAMVS